MSYGIGTIVEVISGDLFLGRWIFPLERGVIVGRHISPAGQEVYDVQLQDDGKNYTFAPSEIDELHSV